MWNESVSTVCEIHEVEEDKWWDFLAMYGGAYHLMSRLCRSEASFSPFDQYFFFDDNDETFISFDSKEEMIGLIGEWFLEEIINRPYYGRN